MPTLHVNGHHFLIVTIAAQGQINPARHLARRLARTANACATLAIPVSSHRRMFPASDGQPVDDEAESLVSYASYSDGYDQGLDPTNDDGAHFMAQLKLLGSETLASLARSLADRGRRVTCVVYTILLPWAADVARDLGVHAVLYWIQPVAVFSTYYYYYHRYGDLISTHKKDPEFALNLPGLPWLLVRDLPSILLDSGSPYLESYIDIMKALERDGPRPRVLTNTFHALEADAIDAIADVNFITVGPIIERSAGKDLFEQDKSEYMEWLDMKEERSVVYVSFGSLSKFSKAQMEEILNGLKESGRPYLWVVRKDHRSEELTYDFGNISQGMVVEWCDQVRVLSHRSVGCFVTHCGWNSTTESMVCGVPMVMVPQWADQATNAKMVEEIWRNGVRAALNEEGVMEGVEMRRCLEIVMGEGERGVEIRNKAEFWKNKAAEAASEDDGPAARNLRAFVDELKCII